MEDACLWDYAWRKAIGQGESWLVKLSDFLPLWGSSFNGSSSQEKQQERCQRLAEHVLNFLGYHDPGQSTNRLLQ